MRYHQSVDDRCIFNSPSTFISFGYHDPIDCIMELSLLADFDVVNRCDLVTFHPSVRKGDIPLLSAEFRGRQEMVKLLFASGNVDVQCERPRWQCPVDVGHNTGDTAKRLTNNAMSRLVTDTDVSPLDDPLLYRMRH